MKEDKLEAAVGAAISDSRKKEEEGWEGTWKVSGIEPERGFRETIIQCVVDNGFVEDGDRIAAIDDWHYQVTGEMRLSRKKEDLLTVKINGALRQAGWNVTVFVKLTANGEASFIIDITQHLFAAYYALFQFASDCEAFDVDVHVSRRNPDELYLKIIRRIFMYEADNEARAEAIQSLLKNGHCEADDDYILKFRPRLLMRDGWFIGDNDLYDMFAFPSTIEYIELPDVDDEEDPDEVYKEFEREILEPGQSLYRMVLKDKL